MTTDLFPAPPMFAATRAEALEQLAAFVPKAGRYARDRNRVLPGHGTVSRLSPAISHGLLTIEDCAAAVLDRYAPSTVEKYLQELQWRRYWKAWLSLRPQVWSDYRADLATLQDDRDVVRRAAQAAAGEGPVAIMNHFARELTETGYLHNHARMWFAGWWVHVERLPWQLGADFFFRHLLDADAASNTLSWRWVAGLQTPGKTYLPRRANLEKYVDPDLLARHRDGLELLERPTAFPPEHPTRPPVTAPELPEEFVAEEPATGLWVHEEDLRPESGPLSELQPRSILLAAGTPAGTLPAPKAAWRQRAFEDSRARCRNQFGVGIRAAREPSLPETLLHWAHEENLRQVVAMRPEVGPLNDLLPQLRQGLSNHGVSLVLLDRPEVRVVRPLATAGFFGFWKKQQARTR